MPRPWLICDFDHSLVDVNTDPFVLEHSGTEGALEELRRRHAEVGQWTDTMALSLAPLTRAAIEKALDAVTLHADMVAALRHARDEADARIVILSDANTVFIAHILAKAGLGALFDRVVSNPASWTHGEDGHEHIVVTRFHSPDAAPHGCEHCPVNLCKRLALADVMRELDDDPAAAGEQTVIYLGDGGNDWCPARDATHLLARDGMGLSRALAKKGPPSATVAVLSWSSYADVLAHVRQILPARQ